LKILGVADDGHRHRRDWPGCCAADVDADQQSDAREPEEEAPDLCPVETVLVAAQSRDQRPHQRYSREQQARKRAREPLFGLEEHQPRQQDLCRGVGEQRPPTAYETRELVSVGDYRQQDQRDGRRAEEDERRRRHFPYRDAYQQVWDAPDDAERAEEQPCAP
jgi:hypothetical protein